MQKLVVMEYFQKYIFITLTNFINFLCVAYINVNVLSFLRYANL